MNKQVVRAVYLKPSSLGEGPLWHVKKQKLFWVDIFEKMLHCLDPITRIHRSWKMPAMIGCIAPRQEGGFIAAMGDGIYFIELPSGKLTKQCDVPGGLRLNDGKCDRQGRFWFGSVDKQSNQACLFCYEGRGKLILKAEHLGVSNGLGWSLDDRIFYHTDSLARKIFAYDFNRETGTISNRRVFVETLAGEGVPDGLTIDQEGYIWSARFNGSKVVRYTPDGKVDREIAMPITRPTSCAFGNKDLDVLYITSSCRDVGEIKALSTPAGILFAADVGVKGLPEAEFTR